MPLLHPHDPERIPFEQATVPIPDALWAELDALALAPGRWLDPPARVGRR